MTNVAQTGLARDLARRAAEGRPVRIGVIGSGEMGTDLVTQGMLMPGISIAAISTRRPHTAREAIRIAYGDEATAAEAETASKVTQAIEAGRIAITSNCESKSSNSCSSSAKSSSRSQSGCWSKSAITRT